MHLKKLQLFVMFSVLAVPAFGDTVEEAVDYYFQVMKSGEYAKSAELFDQEELRSFRESLEFLATAPAASQARVYSGIFGPGATQESVGRMSDAEYFGVFWAMAMSQIVAKGGMEFKSLEYLGYVMEGDEVAHAVTRITVQLPNAELNKMSVASFVRRGENWKMKMSGDIRGIADQIRKVVGM